MDLKAYALGEGSKAEREAVEAHLAESAAAREELQHLEITLAALQSLPDEEIPRRIAFVSDPIFAPSWWQRFWQPGPQAMLGAAAMLAVAIVAHGWMGQSMTPPAAPVSLAQGPAPSAEQMKRVVDDAVSQAVTQALAKAEARQQLLLKDALAQAEQRHQAQRQMMAVSFEENLGLLRKQMNRLYVSTANLTAPNPNPGAPQQ